MNANFRSQLVLPPPGETRLPEIAASFPEPTWWSPALQASSTHLLIGGQTVWVEGGSPPQALVLAHPNRFGGGEDLGQLAALSERYGAAGWVIVDPVLVQMVELPPGLRNATSWRAIDAGRLFQAGERALQAADALRRRLAQVPGLRWPVVRPAGRAVTCLTPVPARQLSDALAGIGVLIEDPLGWWEGIITFTVGWWHTRAQLDGVAEAVADVLAGRPPGSVPGDTFEAIPDDLPRRQLNRIRAHLRGV